MGLLDQLSYNGDPGGGLLAFLNQLQQGAPPTQMGLPSDQAQYGDPANAMAQAPILPQQNAPQQVAPPQPPPAAIPAQQPAQSPLPQPAMQPQAPSAAPDIGVGGHLMAGYQNLQHGGGLIGSLIAGITGQRNDAQGVAQQQQAQVANVTAQALIGKGVPREVAIAAVQPGNTEMLKTLVTQTFGPDKFQHVVVKDANGSERPATFEPSTGKYTFPEGQGTSAPTGPISMEDLQKNDPAMASQVQAVLDGRAPYPTGSRLNSKQQTLKEAVTQIDPTFDSTTSRTRAKFNREFGSTSPSTVGGQKILMGTALGHLGEVAESAAGLGNSDGGGLAMAGHAANAVKNMTTENAAKANALEDKVAKFSGEVGKLYSGSQGGGVHEREDTRARMGANLTSAELASGLEASRDLILSKQKALEDQAVTIFGPEKAAKYDFIGPDGRKSLDKIENAIVKLRGQNAQPNAPAASPAAAPLPKPGDMQGGYRFKGGNPADKANWEQAS